MTDADRNAFHAQVVSKYPFTFFDFSVKNTIFTEPADIDEFHHDEYYAHLECCLSRDDKTVELLRSGNVDFLTYKENHEIFEYSRAFSRDSKATQGRFYYHAHRLDGSPKSDAFLQTMRRLFRETKKFLHRDGAFYYGDETMKQRESPSDRQA